MSRRTYFSRSTVVSWTGTSRGTSTRTGRWQLYAKRWPSNEPSSRDSLVCCKRFTTSSYHLLIRRSFTTRATLNTRTDLGQLGATWIPSKGSTRTSISRHIANCVILVMCTCSSWDTQRVLSNNCLDTSSFFPESKRPATEIAEQLLGPV